MDVRLVFVRVLEGVLDELTEVLVTFLVALLVVDRYVGVVVDDFGVAERAGLVNRWVSRVARRTVEGREVELEDEQPVVGCARRGVMDV